MNTGSRRFSDNSQKSSSRGEGSDDMKRAYSGRPPGLKGKEIGLFYAQRNRARDPEDYAQRQKVRLEQKLEREKRNVCDITLSTMTIQRIRNELQLPNSSEKNKINVFSTFVNDPNINSELKNQFVRVVHSSFDKIISEVSANIQNRKFENALKIEVHHAENSEILENFLNKSNNHFYKEMQNQRQKLPAFSCKDKIVEIINKNQVILIKGETGSGKTTQVPQFILDAAILDNKGRDCSILVTQPRRISAITLAERVAEERAEKLRQSVGYQIRLESKIPENNGSITYCTAGCLLKFMESDPLLTKYSHIILDEIHERDVITDLSLAVIKKILPYRKDLKVILMSATLTAEKFSDYFNSCPILEIEGKMFPVEEFYLEDILSEIKFYNFESRSKNRYQNEYNAFIEPYIRSIAGKYPKNVLNALKSPESEKNQTELIVELVRHITTYKPPGAILVFLPTVGLITDALKAISNDRELNRLGICAYPLHSKLPQIDQKHVFKVPPEGCRKVILATNIAETSITIEDIVYVINSGKQILNTFENNISTLKTEWISNTNQTQRKGRSGRTGPGICYHLYTRARKYTFEETVLPEIKRVGLDNVILTVKIHSLGKAKSFLLTLIDPPDQAAIEKSIELLTKLNALDTEENLTPLGYHLAKLPLDARTGKMVLLSSIFGCIDPIASIAASLSFKDAFYRPLNKEKEVARIRKRFADESQSDHLMLANVMKHWKSIENGQSRYNFCRDNFLNNTTLNQLDNMKGQFCELLYNAKFLPSTNISDEESNKNSRNVKLLKALICAGLFPNIAYVRKIIRSRNSPDAKRIILHIEDCGRAEISDSSVNSKLANFESNFLVYYEKQKIKSLLVFDSTVVNPYPILFFGETQVDSQPECEYISVAGHPCFKCNKETLSLIMDLRHGFDLLLQRKICDPSPVDWTSDEGVLLSGIIDLITISGKFDEHDDFDDEEDDN